MIPYNPDSASTSGNAYPVLEAGEYKATLIGVEISEQTTYICQYQVFSPTVPNGSIVLKDWLNMTKGVCVHRLKNMARAMNRIEDFDAGTFDPASATNYTMTLKISKKASRDGVGHKNWIDDIVTVESTASPAAEVKQDLPF